MNKNRDEINALKDALWGDPIGLLGALFHNKQVKQYCDGWRVGTHGSLSVRRDGVWHCHESGSGGDVFALIQYAFATDFSGALAWAKSYCGGRTTKVARSVEQAKPDYNEARQAYQDKQSARARNVWMQAQSPNGLSGGAHATC